MRRIARGGQSWRVGTSADVAWISAGTAPSRTINAAIPLVFEAYATVVVDYLEDEAQDRHDRAVLSLLTEHSAGQPWWLGYLDTGVGELGFTDAPMVTVFYGWRYVLVEAGQEQAATWRRSSTRFRNTILPDLMFPADRSWLLSTLWDDDWSCLGGPASLVAAFLAHPDLEARQVAPGQDVAPPDPPAVSPH